MAVGMCLGLLPTLAYNLRYMISGEGRDARRGPIIDIPPPIMYRRVVTAALGDAAVPALEAKGSWAQTEERIRKAAQSIVLRTVHTCFRPESEEGAFNREFPNGQFAALQESARFTHEDVSDICAVSYSTVLRIGADIRPSHTMVLRGKLCVPTKLYGVEGVADFVHYIDQVPIADATDVPLADLKEQLGWYVYSYSYGHPELIRPQLKRRPRQGRHVKAYLMHVTAEEAAILRDPPRVPVATHTHMSMTELAKKADVSLHVAIRAVARLAQDRPSIIVPLRPGNGPRGRARDYLHRRYGEDLADAIRPVKLLPHQIAQPMLMRYFGRNASFLQYRMEQAIERDRLDPTLYAKESLNLGGRQSQVVAYSWDALGLLEDSGVPVAEGITPIDRSRLARNPDTDDWSYSQQVQRQLISPDKLEHRQVYMEELSKRTWHAVRMATGCDEQAFQWLIAHFGLTEDDVTTVTIDDQAHTAFSRSALRRLSTFAVDPIPPGWGRLAFVARNGASTQEEAYKVLVRHEQAQQEPFGMEDCRLGRNGTKVELYLAPHISRPCIAKMRPMLRHNTGNPT